MKLKFVKGFYLLLFFLFAACLPQEKTTQCDSNEAYDATARRCVATLGASSSTVNISNVTPAASYAISSSAATKTHAITVSDPYNNGYQVRWNLTQPNGSVLNLSSGLSVGINPSSYAQGSYVLEVQLLNSTGVEVFDTRSWTVNIVGNTTPTISPVTASPFTTTTTNSATTISATASNPDSIANVNYQWYVNGSAIAGQSGTFSTSSQPLSFSFDPTSAASYFAGAGVYSVQLVLSENGTSATYASETWTITNNIPNFANVSLGTSGTFGTTTPSTATTITVIDENNISAANAFLSGGSSVDFCVQVDNVGGVDSDGVFVDFQENGVNIPLATNIQLVTNNTPICLGAVLPTYNINIDASINSVARTLTAVVYDKYSGVSARPKHNGYTQLDSFSWTTIVRQKNTKPVIEIKDATTNAISCAGKTGTLYSNCTITQGTNFQIEISVTDDDYNPNDVSGSGIGYEKFAVNFFLDGTLLGSAHPLSDDDCVHAAAETNNVSRYVCSLEVNPYDTNGPIDPTGKNYTLTAEVVDVGSPYVAIDSKQSNTVTWQVTTVNDSNTGIDINEFADDAADLTANPTFSYISEPPAPGATTLAGPNSINESDIIQFHVRVNDPERDSHTIKIERCLDVACATVISPELVTNSVTSTDATNPRLTSINYQIGEDEVTGATSGTVFYRVSATDSYGATNATTRIISLAVDNNNPDPTFNSASFNPAQATALTAFTGFPLTIDPGTVSDTSTADGNTVLYQWMIMVDNNNDGDFDDGETFSPISGATKRQLIWTPGSQIDFATQTGTATRIKLCIGDDGVDGAGAPKIAMNGTSDDCKAPALDTGVWNLTVFSNMAIGQAYNDNTAGNTAYADENAGVITGGEMAVWVDPSSVNPVVQYMAYVSKGRDIIVEKIVTTTNGTKHGSIEQTTEELAQIQFNASTDIGYASNPVTYLSMTGDSTNNALYIAYMAPIGGVDQVHVRRIDISTGKAGFTHQGKFGFDPGYNNMTDNISITSVGINSPAVENSSGLMEITFTDSASNQAMSVAFSGLHGGSATLTAGTGTFCNPTSACSSINDTATNFAAAINASTEKELQGITASATGAVVTLSGNAAGEFYQADAGATRIGSIMVNNSANKWVLPLIDHDLSASDKNKVSLLQGDLNVRLNDANIVKTALTVTNPAVEIANDISGSNRAIIAIKRETTGEIDVYELDATNALVDTNADIFGNTSVANIKVAVGKETSAFQPSAFIVGTNVNNRLTYARVDATAGNFNLTTPTAQLELDAGFTLIQGVKNFDITAGPSQYQMLMGVVADADSNTDFEAYLINVTGATPTAGCSYDSAARQTATKCTKLLTTATPAEDEIFNLPIKLGNVLKDVTIGTAGFTANENRNHIIPVGFFKDDGGDNVENDAIPVTGILNVSDTTITADETGSNVGNTVSLPYVAN